MAWHDLLGVSDVAPGAVVGVEVGARELVVWRSAEGRPVVCDARCPHQWSHLAAEGAVDGDELVCLSHFWRFDGCGTGSKVNVKGRRDPKGDLVVFACRERRGRIEADLPHPSDAPGGRDDM